jgi:gamma-glutamyltranspeptidase
MTPTIVLRNGAPAFVTGAPGGSRIITTVLQVLVNAIDFDKPIAEAVAAPRVHDQWLPDEVVAEATLSPRAHHQVQPRCVDGARAGDRSAVVASIPVVWPRPLG